MGNITKQIANDRLAALLAFISAVGLFLLYLYGGLELEQAAEVKGLSEAAGGFVLLALGRDKHERGKATDEPAQDS